MGSQGEKKKKTRTGGETKPKPTFTRLTRGLFKKLKAILD
jgi:hypothetical protein